MREEHSFSSPQEFSSWIQKFAKQLTGREIILLTGDLGAGKTFFVTELLHSRGGLGGASPSFAIHNHYETPQGDFEHVDLYRLKNLEDLESTGFWDLFAQDKAIIAVEWANKLSRTDFPTNWPIWEIEILIDKNIEKRRKVILSR